MTLTGNVVLQSMAESKPCLITPVRLPVWSRAEPSEEPSPANEDDKQPLHSEAMGTQREGVRGQRMKRQHLCSHLTGWKKSGRRGWWWWWRGVWERVGVALESRMEDTSLPAAAVRGKGTQGLLFPLRSLSPGRSLVFPQQTVGTMKAACSPPLAQKGCQYWTYQTLNGRISLPMKIKSMTCFPWLSSLWSGWQL